MFKLGTDTYSADMGNGEQGSRDDNDDRRGIDRVEGGYMYEKIEIMETMRQRRKPVSTAA